MLFESKQLPISQRSSTCSFEPTGQHVFFDYHVWGAMLKKYHKLQPKPKTLFTLRMAPYVNVRRRFNRAR